MSVLLSCKLGAKNRKGFLETGRGSSKYPPSSAPLVLPPFDAAIRAELGCKPFPQQEPPGIPFSAGQDLEGIPLPI